MVNDRQLRRTGGFTLIELVTTIAIIGLLLAIMLPAVMYTREASRRAQCMMNLKQIGLALNVYHSDHGCFPPAVVAGYSPHTMLLPYLEQAGMYNSINTQIGCFYSLDSTQGQNITFAIETVGVFLCPSDQSHSEGGWTNYAANLGTHHPYLHSDGAFRPPHLGPPRVQDITDGTSTTAAFTESVTGSTNSGSRNDRLATIFSLFPALWNDDEFELFIRNCASASDGTPVALQEKGRPWLQAGFPYTWYHHAIVPNGNSCRNGWSYEHGAVTASSRHSNGVNVLFSDGTVRFVSDTVSLETWRAIGTRASGEIIPSF